MKLAVEILRWSLVVIFGAAALCILGIGCDMAFASDTNVWAWLTVLLSVVWAAFPGIFAYFAYARRWRDLLAFPIVILTVFAWYQFIMLPQWLWPLEPLIPQKPGDPRWMEGIIAAAHLLFFLFSFRFADWVYRRLVAMVVRLIPPDPPVKEWIMQAT